MLSLRVAAARKLGRPPFHRRMQSTLNKEEVNKFKAISSEWWNPQGPASGLHSMNGVRVPLVTNGLAKLGKTQISDRPLKGLRIVDVGCGGGILSEALARLGATVVGLDPCEENVIVAQEHSEKDSSICEQIKYLPITADHFLQYHHDQTQPFDAVVSSEVIEHVDNPAEFVHICSRLVGDNGSLFFTTLNRTTKSWVGAIVAAEHILRLLPLDTHDWHKFITPEELTAMVEASGCRVRLVHGMFYVPWVNKWTWFPDTAVNYAMHAIKCAQ
jgi:polyprenyldihydroxybenzoate methyltransferase/3-demethylubiquinol 3-O-methyltransferase